MNRLQNSFMSMDRVADAYLKNQKGKPIQTTQSETNLRFEQILEQTANAGQSNSGVIFSKHASERLARRNIDLSEEQMNRLNQGILLAKDKHINDSLVMMDNLAFIVNIKNNTVITAMDQEANENNVFTNIDGAIIV